MIENYYKNEIALHNIDISFQLPSTPLMINGNTELLSKTVMSLLANAVYAVCKKDEKKERTESGLAIKLKLHQSGKTAYLTIHDNGTGISENILHKIFDPFFTTKTTGEASGVGLYLSKEITQNHGGDITVESVKNEYTEFTITLPTL
jgi:signal transduction histidine kinase